MNIDVFLKSLPVMGYGMLGIFIVIGCIVVITSLLSKIFPEKKDK
ncbi:OadG-related small transporter subunit [Paludicola sp. MB14-C6]|nr:OadG-related small transporter subunit [Paludicola sp. MB14-C6]WMJ21945.1 OadG-related small transporter subunit [Paludicola sp. MB14-C6]